jgi:hypothetical protein
MSCIKNISEDSCRRPPEVERCSSATSLGYAVGTSVGGSVVKKQQPVTQHVKGSHLEHDGEDLSSPVS